MSPEKTKSVNPEFLDNKVMFVDGLIGGGKTLISQILSSVKNVEMWAFKSKYEHICALNELNEIDDNGASTIIKLWIDEEVDDCSILRNVNYRYQDQSSILKYPRLFEYLKRAFEPGGKNSLDKFVEQKRILNFMTHSNTPFSKPIFEALNERLIFIRFTRCPMSIYMINHLSRWSKRFGEDVRNGMLLSKAQGSEELTPFFIKKRREEYIAASPIDRAIYMLEEWQERGDLFIEEAKKNYDSEIIEIPFEEFVFEPEKFLVRITSILDTEIDSKVRKEMKKQRVPRRSLSDAPYDKNFKRMGWASPVSHPSLMSEIEDTQKKIKNDASEKAFNVLMQITENYLTRYKIN